MTDASVVIALAFLLFLIGFAVGALTSRPRHSTSDHDQTVADAHRCQRRFQPPTPCVGAHHAYCSCN